MVGTWGHLTTKYRFPRICCEQQACSASRSLACRYICITSMLKLSRVTRQQRKHFFFCYDSGITREAGDLLTLTSSAQRGNWKWTARWSLPKICHLRVIVPECCFFSVCCDGGNHAAGERIAAACIRSVHVSTIDHIIPSLTVSLRFPTIQFSHVDTFVHP